MIFYITVLRAMASILITNAHYNNIYPLEIIANGGLLGDVIFFAVSGFCLYNIRLNFGKWFGKRILRIYPAVWIITIIYLMLGLYNFNDMNIIQYFIYPTYYHFIASIVILYIFYYIIIRNEKLKEKIPLIMFIIFIIQLVIYIFFYDKTYYHIDTVREPMIRFLFMQAMLLGAIFRQKNDKYININKKTNWVILFLCIIIYFGGKIIFSKKIIVEYQLLNQIILFITLYWFFRCFSGINIKLENLPTKIKKIINFLAEITLEIYVVQYPLIPLFDKLPFPINWILVTTTILVSAYILHIISKFCIRIIEGRINCENTYNRSIEN